MTSSDRVRAAGVLTARVLFGSGAVVALVMSAVGSEPRWQKTSGVLLALAVLLAAVLETRWWKPLRVAVGAVVGLLLAVAGAVAGSSLDESFGLISCAFLLSGIAWVLASPERREADRRSMQTLAALTAVQTELAALRASLLTTST